MQTFMPYSRFDASAAVLDDLRLGKQRVETLQILRALLFPSYQGWKNHPATAMWRGFTSALVAYGVAVCDEWERRGRADAVRGSLLSFTGGRTSTQRELTVAGAVPPWVGAAAMHRSHRAALVRKLPEHYRDRFADADPGTPYEWPPSLLPRWPVQRSRRLSIDAAVGALGLRHEPPGCREVVAAVQRDDVVRLPADDDSRRVAAVATLCAAGPTVWVVGGADDQRPPPTAQIRPEVAERPPGRVSPSVARPPTPDDVAAVVRASRARRWLHGYRESALASPAVRAAMPAPGLLVVEDAESALRRLRGVGAIVLGVSAGRRGSAGRA